MDDDVQPVALGGGLAGLGELVEEKHDGNVVVTGAGELGRELSSAGSSTRCGWVTPYLLAEGPGIFDDVGPVRLDLVSTASFPSGVVKLSSRPAPATIPGEDG